MRMRAGCAILAAAFLAAAGWAAQEPVPVPPGSQVAGDLRLSGEDLRQLIGNVPELGGVTEVRVVTYRFPPPPGPGRVPETIAFFEREMAKVDGAPFLRHIGPQEGRLAFRDVEGGGFFSVLAMPHEAIATRVSGRIDLRHMPLLERALRRAAVGGEPLGMGVRQRLDGARRLLESWRSDEAEREYRSLVAANPNVPPAHLGLALALSACGQIEEAAAEFRKAIELDPLQAAARLEYARLLGWKKGDWQNALYEIGQAAALAPGSAAPREWLGAAYEKMGRFREAAAAVRSAIAMGGASPQSYLRLGRVLEKTGAKDQALAAYKDALKLDPELASAREAVRRLSR